MSMRYLCVAPVLAGGLLLSSCRSDSPKTQTLVHPVAVKPVVAMAKSVPTTLVGKVTLRGAGRTRGEAIGETSDYRVTVSLPAGVKPDLGVGRSVRVLLPVLHHQETRASVESVGEKSVSLSLTGQIHELNGNVVRAEIPIQAKGIFRVPFEAIYSPRGMDKQVFVLRGDRVEAREVAIVAMATERELLVAGSLEPSDRIVTQGLDNLLSGDAVTVVKSEEVSHD